MLIFLGSTPYSFTFPMVYDYVAPSRGGVRTYYTFTTRYSLHLLQPYCIQLSLERRLYKGKGGGKRGWGTPILVRCMWRSHSTTWKNGCQCYYARLGESLLPVWGLAGVPGQMYVWLPWIYPGPHTSHAIGSKMKTALLPHNLSRSSH